MFSNFTDKKLYELIIFGLPSIQFLQTKKNKMHCNYIINQLIIRVLLGEKYYSLFFYSLHFRF